MNNDEFKITYELWNNFIKCVTTDMRYFVKHELLDHIKQLAIKNTMILQKSSKFYRARIYTLDQYLEISRIFMEYLKMLNSDPVDTKDLIIEIFRKKELQEKLDVIKSKFWGYPKGENLMPPKNISTVQGRGNPQYISYLYLVDSPYTALVEVKPSLDSKVSIAEITCNRDLKIADFSYDAYQGYDTLMYLLCGEFSKPFLGTEKQYIPTQIIAEYLKNEGFQGIKYNSSINKRGRNYMFYDDIDFEDISSTLYKVKDTYFVAKSINNVFDENAIYPETLKEYFDKNQEEIIKPITEEEDIDFKKYIDFFIQSLD